MPPHAPHPSPVPATSHAANPAASPAARPARIPAGRHAVAATVVVTALTLVATLLLAAAPSQAAKKGPVDAYAPYEPQNTCQSVAQPGTLALVRYLSARYKAHRNFGTVRSCGSGGGSEHKDGRAVDWMVDAAIPDQRAAADKFMDKLFATQGTEPNALARRMGVMYVIYRGKIWSSYREFKPQNYVHYSCDVPKRCSRTLLHYDHVHVSLSRAGGAGLTSYWVSKGVTPGPITLPPVDPTTPVEPTPTTPVTPITPVTPTPTTPVPEEGAQTIKVPGNGTEVLSKQIAGRTRYRLIVSGVITTKNGTADAACKYNARKGWVLSTPAVTTAVTPVPPTLAAGTPSAAASSDVTASHDWHDDGYGHDHADHHRGEYGWWNHRHDDHHDGYDEGATTDPTPVTPTPTTPVPPPVTTPPTIPPTTRVTYGTITPVRRVETKTVGLVINKKARLPATCNDAHLYETWVKFPSRRKLKLRFTKPGLRGATGKFTVVVIRDPEEATTVAASR